MASQRAAQLRSDERDRRSYPSAKLYLLLLLCGADAAAQQVIPLTAVSGYSPTALWVETFLTHFIPEADQQLAATRTYEIDWNTPFGSVAKPGGAFETVQYGLADIGIITTSFHSDKIPFYNLSYVTPFVTTDMGLVVRTVSELHERYPALKQLWRDYGQVYLVTAGLVDTYQALMSQPITALDDFRGLKMSGVGMNLRYFEGLGAIAVSSGLADFYTNIATGLTDGAIVWAEAIVSFKLYEVGPYLVDVRLGAVSSVAISANERTWERLPDEVRRALLAAAAVYRDELALETVRRSAAAMEAFEALGGTIISLSDEQRREWAASVPDLAGAWVADIEQRGLPGRELLQAYMNTMRANGQPILRHWDRE
ncbi:MAG: C4-dicarboxylate ABC transporter [Gammaproteobacteria bacterium]|nr:MAG: C4-dicarboxylate ABC transporter [Gammaproteobacteria bacterium]